MQDTFEKLKKLNQILDQLENPVIRENKKLKKLLDGRIELCPSDTMKASTSILLHQK